MRTLNTTFKNTITNNFNDEIIYTSSTGRDLKNEIRSEARKYNKLEFNLIADYYDKLFLQESNYKYSGIRMSITRRF